MKRGIVALAVLLCGSAAALLPTGASAAPASPNGESFVSVGSPDFDEVDQGCATTSTYDSTQANDGNLAVGNNIWGPPCKGIDRSYFQFQLPQLPAGATIQQASVTATEVFTSSCETRPISLKETGPISPETDWNNQPSIGPTLGTYVFAGFRPGSSSCGGGAVAGSFDVTAAIEQAVSNGWTQITVVLTNDTDNGVGFARFADNPDLQIGYTPAS